MSRKAVSLYRLKRVVRKFIVTTAEYLLQGFSVFRGRASKPYTIDGNGSR